VSTAATQLTQTPLCEEAFECELFKTYGTPIKERPGRISGSVQAKDVEHVII
jgi:hypothetical protein